MFSSDLFKRFYLSIFGERGREGEKEREKHQCVVVSHAAPTGDVARNPGTCPDWESNRQPCGSQSTLNPLSHTSQGSSDLLFSVNYSHPPLFPQLQTQT